MKGKHLLALAMIAGLVFHGTSLIHTFEGTYDAYVHIFFGDHYASDWFSSWNKKWYTGFTTTSYPPLVHQLTGLLSKVVGLKPAFVMVGLAIILIFIRGVYAFSGLWVDNFTAGLASILAVFSTSFTEALHLFGQLPSILGISLLLNACPEIYKWLRYDNNKNLILAFSLLAVTSTAHHVTTIFGLVFFIMPVLGLAVIDRAQSKKSTSVISILDFINEAISLLPRLILFGVVVIAITVVIIFPYWYWSKSDPISQVPIPHGSRDSFLEVFSSGLVFFIIPWTLMLLFLPYLFSQTFKRRNIFLGLSVALAFLLGTGGTTPIPEIMLGSNAFNILTLDRFTFWATMLSLPFWADFMRGLYLHGRKYSSLLLALFSFIILGLLIANILIINLTSFKKIQPDKVEIEPITRFLEVDKHDQWRYLTLGFGDQMAWLSANTEALTVDGNYHSARRLPELTSRAVERLESAKYLGHDGILSLQQFLTNPEKFHLKYIFSNDKFYDPILFYTGWSLVRQLDNNIFVWERKDISMLPEMVPEKQIPDYQRFMWGILPLANLLLCILLIAIFFKSLIKSPEDSPEFKIKTSLLNYNSYWAVTLIIAIVSFSSYSSYREYKRSSPENVLESYFHALDFKKFDIAYKLIDPDDDLSFEAYQISVSMQSGILSSYAKLDSLEMTFEELNNSTIKSRVEAHWLSSLNEYTSSHEFKLVKKGLFWYIKAPEVELNIPPDKIIYNPDANYFLQGKRKIGSVNLASEDILDRPKVFISEAVMVQSDSQYHIIGQITNMDAVPAYLSAMASLFDITGQEIVTASVKDIFQRRLLPGEKTSFRIDFNEAFETYGISGNINVQDFKLFVSSTVTDEPMYRYVGIDNIEFTENRFSATLVNFGHKEIIIPQIILSYFDQPGHLLWVEKQYLPFGIKQQRKQAFSIPLDNKIPLRKYKRALKGQLFVNGKINADNVKEIGILRHRLNAKQNSFLEIDINAFTESELNE